MATHQDRYNFCQTYPNDVYRDVNPSGDAKTQPTTLTDYDGAACTLQDCQDEFDDSYAATGDNACGCVNISFTAPTTC